MRYGLALFSVLFAAACGGEDAAAVDLAAAIDRDVFVQTYVELRLEALDNSATVITKAELDQILNERAVSEEELRHFVEVHGADVEYMRDLWKEIEDQIDRDE